MGGKVFALCVELVLGHEIHFVFECAALHMRRDAMPAVFQGVHSLRCFVWQVEVRCILSFSVEA